MEGNKPISTLLILFVGVACLLPIVNAHIEEWDEVWRRRADEAWNRTLQAYHPNPDDVIDHLNAHVNRALKEIEEDEGISLVSNSSRRILRGKKNEGPCRATNPIDRCWRCQPNWAENRFRLADCVLGFGRRTTGGKNGKIYVVTDPSDEDIHYPRPGTLRHAVIQKEPLWIVFHRRMLITLKQELMVQSHKTIDGRGTLIDIAYGAGITLQYVRNVIIHGIKIHHIVSKDGGMLRDSVDHYGFRSVSDGDGISIFGSQDIWIDHVSMTRCADGMIDAIQGSTAITISNNHLTDHDKVLLFGGGDSDTRDQKMQITVAFNHFGKRLVQRMPRCRFGYIHVVNNDYTHWLMYAIGGSSHPTIISQGNRYRALKPTAREVTKRVDASESEWKGWTWISDGDVFEGGAYFVPSGDQSWTKKHPEVYDKIVAAPGKYASEMSIFSGRRNCKRGKPC